MAITVVWIFPILTAIFGIATFVVGYAIAVARKDEAPWFSYISDGGAFPPESCVFGELLSLAAFFFAITAYLRHSQYIFHMRDVEGISGKNWRTRLSVVMLWFGWVSAFGLTIVANFQEFNVPKAHFSGAFVAFSSGLTYCWGQAILSYASRRPRMTPLLLVLFRFLMTLICSFAFVLYLVASQGSVFVKKDANGIKPTPVPYARPPFYTPDSPFYVNRLVATISEWVVAICFQAVILSLTWEMRDYHLHAPKTRYVGRRKPFGGPTNGAASKTNGHSKSNGHVFPAKDEDDALSWRL